MKSEFNIWDFVPAEKKVTFIGQTIEESFVDGIVNPMLLEYLFLVNLILTYSDLEVNLQEEDKLAIYDQIITLGIKETFEEKMAEKYHPDEIETLWGYTQEWAERFDMYHNSINGVLENLKVLVDVFSNKITENINNLNETDLTTLKQVIPLAKSLGIDLQTEEKPDLEIQEEE